MMNGTALFLSLCVFFFVIFLERERKGGFIFFFCSSKGDDGGSYMLGAKKGIVRRLTNIRMKLRPSSWVSFAWRCLFFVCVALFHSGSNRTEQRNWKINQFEAGNLYKLGSRWMTLVASGIESTAAAASAKKKGKKKRSSSRSTLRRPVGCHCFGSTICSLSAGI